MAQGINDGGPAFPAKGQDGISLRRWFAGQALNGLCAAGTVGSRPDANDDETAALVRRSYKLADVMISVELADDVLRDVARDLATKRQSGGGERDG